MTDTPLRALTLTPSNCSLFRYETEGTDRGRTWRPDLVPVIVSWLDGIPSWRRRYLTRIAVTASGGFGAQFSIPRSDGTGERTVLVKFDHGVSVVQSDNYERYAESIVPFNWNALVSLADKEPA